MIRIQRILFPTDFSPSAEHAFDTALLLAREFEAELHMLHAVVLHDDDPHDPAHHFPEPDEIRRRLEELGEAAMAELVSASDDDDVEIHRLQRCGFDAASVILEYADESDADLIVMGTHGRRGPAHFLLGSVAERVVRHATTPTLTVRGGDASPSTVGSILVPVDLSKESRSALLAARELAERYGARTHAAHVVLQPIYPAYTLPAIDLAGELKKRATAALGELVTETFGTEPGIDTSVVSAQRAAPEIIRIAQETNADLIVLATHGYGPVEHLFIGRTAERVVQMSPVPVLVLRSSGKSLLVEDGEETTSQAGPRDR